MSAFLKIFHCIGNARLLDGDWQVLNDIIVRWSFSFDLVKQLILQPIIVVATGLPASLVMRTVLVKLKVTQKSVRLQVIYFLCITLVFTTIEAFVWLGLEYRFMNYYEILNLKPNFWGRYIQLYNAAFGLFLGWNFIYFTYHYVKNVRKQDQAKIEMQYKMLELEAFALRATMNPHFIFDCLNSIQLLIQQNENEKLLLILIPFQN